MKESTSLFEKFRLTGKHGIVYGIGSIIEKAITFILLPLYTTRFTASDYGILGLVTVTGSILAAIFTIGMNYGLLRSYYDYRDEKDRKAVISTAFYIVLLSTFIMLVLGLAFSRNFSELIFKSGDYRLHFIIIVITSAFSILNVVPFTVFRVRMKSLQFIILQAVFLLIGIGTIIYLVNYRKWGVLGALTGNLIMAAVSCFTLYICIRKDIVARFIKPEFKKMLLLGSPLIPGTISVFVFTAIDRYFLNYYTNTHEVGLYNLAYNFGNIVTVLLATPISLVWPAMYLSVKDHDNAEDFYSRALTYALSISFFLFLIFSLLSKEALKIFSNEEFWDAYAVIPIIVLTYSIWSVRKIINVAVTIKRKTQGMAVIEIIGAVVNIGLNFLLIPRYGIWGAAYATLTTYIVVTLLLFLYNQKLMKLYYEWGRILKLVAVTGIIFAAGYLIVIDDMVLSIVFKVIIILLYPLLLFVVRFYTGGEIEKAGVFMKSLPDRLRRRKK
ncbi:MAG: oligosaccharide flippase family protein [Actinobacteria bacterium]|nr:oligosaccharide flippase family protein [Actinomycetota bacterium]